MHASDIVYKVFNNARTTFVVSDIYFYKVFLRPTIAEIVAEYKRVHGKNAPSEELSDEEGQEEDQAEEDQAEELSD